MINDIEVSEVVLSEVFKYFQLIFVNFVLTNLKSNDSATASSTLVTSFILAPI